jgi:hypothetical protein
MSSDSTQPPPAAPYPTLRAVISNKRLVTSIGAAAAFALGCWLAYRTGLVEIYAFAVFAAVAVHWISTAAIEVVELVADTLMPR